jgi:hypothetical protein
MVRDCPHGCCLRWSEGGLRRTPRAPSWSFLENSTACLGGRPSPANKRTDACGYARTHQNEPASAALLRPVASAARLARAALRGAGMVPFPSPERTHRGLQGAHHDGQQRPAQLADLGLRLRAPERPDQGPVGGPRQQEGPRGGPPPPRAGPAPLVVRVRYPAGPSACCQRPVPRKRSTSPINGAPPERLLRGRCRAVPMRGHTTQ